MLVQICMKYIIRIAIQQEDIAGVPTIVLYRHYLFISKLYAIFFLIMTKFIIAIKAKNVFFFSNFWLSACVNFAFMQHAI